MVKADERLIIEIDAELSSFKKKLSGLAKISVTALASMVAAIGGVSIAAAKAGIDFESAFAGVKKTVDATGNELDKLRNGILQIARETPLVATEIAGIAEAAGQLGIKTKNIEGFTRVMTDLGTATNLSGQEAATTLARFANITQMAQTNFDRLGSSIVALGNNMATTESEIAAMALNIAGAGKQVGMSESQMLGLSAALSSVGIEAQAGGTAMSTLIINMKKATIAGGDDLENFAKAAGMTAKQFKKAFETDAAGAIETFIKGLSTASERGANAFTLLEDAGINETRMIRALNSLSGASNVLTDAFNISNTAWTENIALTKEASQRYETTESKLKILQNRLTETGITAFEKFREPFRGAIEAGITSIDELNKSLSGGKLSASISKVSSGFSELLAKVITLATKGLPYAIDSLAWIMDNGTKIVTVLGAIAVASNMKSAIKTVNVMRESWVSASKAVVLFSKDGALASKLATGGLSLMQTAYAVLTGKINLASAAAAVFKALTSPQSLLIAAAAIGALAVGYHMFSEKTKTANDIAKENLKLIKEMTKANEESTAVAQEKYYESTREINQMTKYANQLSGVIDENGKLVGSKEEIKAKVDELNTALGESVYRYDEEKNKIYDNKGAVDDLKASLAELINLKKAEAWINANADKYTETLKQQNELTKAQMANVDKYNALMQESDAKAMESLQKLIASYNAGIISKEEFTSSYNKLAPSDDLVRKTTELSTIMSTMKITDEQIKSNEDFANTFIMMEQAIQKVDVGTMNKITAGMTAGSFETGLKGVKTALDGVKGSMDELSKLDAAKAMGLTIPATDYENATTRLNGYREALVTALTDLTGVDTSSFTRLGEEAILNYADSIVTNAQAQLPDKIKGVLELPLSPIIEANTKSGEQGALTYTTKYKEGLDSILPNTLANSISSSSSSATEASELIGTSGGTALVNKFESSVKGELKSKVLAEIEDMKASINNSLSGFNPTLRIRLEADVDPRLSSYGWSGSRASYDENSSRGSIYPDFGSLVSSAKLAFGSIPNSVSSFVVGAKQSKHIIDKGTLSVQQYNSFNVPIDKPSETLRKIETTAKKLASIL